MIGDRIDLARTAVFATKGDAMKACSPTVAATLMSALLLSGCDSGTGMRTSVPAQASVKEEPEKATQDVTKDANRPNSMKQDETNASRPPQENDVIEEGEQASLNAPNIIGGGIGAYLHVATINIWRNGDWYLTHSLVDTEKKIAAEQLGTYLLQVAFINSQKTPIRADDGDFNKARLKGKFDLSLQRLGSSPPVLRVSFDELRLTRAPSEPGTWVLSEEGIDLIEKAVGAKEPASE